MCSVPVTHSGGGIDPSAVDEGSGVGGPGAGKVAVHHNFSLIRSKPVFPEQVAISGIQSIKVPVAGGHINTVRPEGRGRHDPSARAEVPLLRS